MKSKSPLRRTADNDTIYHCQQVSRKNKQNLNLTSSCWTNRKTETIIHFNSQLTGNVFWFIIFCALGSPATIVLCNACTCYTYVHSKMIEKINQCDREWQQGHWRLWNTTSANLGLYWSFLVLARCWKWCLRGAEKRWGWRQPTGRSSCFFFVSKSWFTVRDGGEYFSVGCYVRRQALTSN